MRIPLLLCLMAFATMARASENPPSEGGKPEDPLVAKARHMMESDALVNADAFAALVKSPQPAPLTLLPPSVHAEAGREIAARAAQGYVRAGWLYHCAKCGRWHTTLAGGYAIAGNVVATAFHVMQPPIGMKGGEGCPLVVRGNDEILPVTAVLTSDEKLDAILLRLSSNGLKPLALSGDVRVGDGVYCLSDPRGVRGYFSAGMVNRLYSINPGARGDARFQRLNVSADWAPGSSGAAVLDDCANVVGHVARIQSFLSNPQEGGHDSKGAATMMVLHEAVPAKSVLEMIRTMNEALKK